jgi:hypothetical protein
MQPIGSPLYDDQGNILGYELPQKPNSPEWLSIIQLEKPEYFDKLKQRFAEEIARGEIELRLARNSDLTVRVVNKDIINNKFFQDLEEKMRHDFRRKKDLDEVDFHKQPHEVQFEIVMPKTTLWQPQTAKLFLEMLYRLPSSFSLNIAVQMNNIIWHISLEEDNQVEENEVAMRNALALTYPDAQITVRKPSVYIRGLYWSHRCSVKPQRPFLDYLFAEAGEFTRFDPLSAMVRAMAANLKDDEEILYTLRVGPQGRLHARWGWTVATMKSKLSVNERDKQIGANWQERAKKFFRHVDFDIEIRMWDLKRTQRVTNSLKETLKLYESKANLPRGLESNTLDLIGYSQVDNLNMALMSKDYPLLRAKYNAANLPWLTKSVEMPGVTNIVEEIMVRLAPDSNPDNWAGATFEPKQGTHFQLLLTADELAGLWHLPTKDFADIPGIWHRGPSLEVFKELTMPHIVIGTVEQRGETLPVKLPYEDRIDHLSLIGQPAVGKSTLMLNMAYQDIKNGHGVVVIDPHGDLVKELLAIIPPEREQEVILFDVGDKDCPLGLNLLTVPPGLDPEDVAAEALGVMKKMFEGQWSETQMQTAIHSALLALVQTPGTTLLEIPRMFTDPAFRARIVANITDPIQRLYWQVNETLSSGKQQTIVGPIINRLSNFYSNRAMRRITCQSRSLKFRHVLETRKIFLANLADARGPQAEILGALLIAKIYLAAMSFANVPQHKRPETFVYIDEVQRFITTTLNEVLAETRKFGLRLTVGNQFLSQLAGPALDAVFGAVGTHITFAVGKPDAKALEDYTDDFTNEDLMNLDLYHAVVKMKVAKKRLPAFAMMTLPPPQRPSGMTDPTERIRDYSCKTYGRPASEIDAEINQRYQAAVGEPLSAISPSGEIRDPSTSASVPTASAATRPSGDLNLDKDIWE